MVPAPGASDKLRCREESEPACVQSADANDDGDVDISDPLYSLSFLFLGGPLIRPPHPGCGAVPVSFSLSCESFPPCGN